MTRISAEKLAAQWTQRFADVVKEASGKDGRLSLSEASRISERLDSGRLWSDNAVNALVGLGQKTISAEKLVTLGGQYALAAAKRAAGKDGFLSANEAKRLPKDLVDDFEVLAGKPIDEDPRTPEQLQADVRDQVLRTLDGQYEQRLPGPPASVRGRKPLLSGLEHPETKTRADVYVADGQVYVSRASDTPSPYVGWYRIGSLPAPSTGRAELRGAIDAATDGLWVMSESDAQVRFVLAEGAAKSGVSADLVQRALGSTHDSLMHTIFGGYRDEVTRLSEKPSVEERDASEFLARYAEPRDPTDPAQVETAQRFAALKQVLEANLTDLKVYRFGSPELSTFVVGRTRSGDLAGVLTAQVET